MARIGQLLVRADLVSENNLARALGIQHFAGGRLGTLLLERGSIDEDSLGKTLALQHGCEYIPWRVLSDISPVVIAALPAKFAIKHAAVPYERGENHLKLVLRDPGDLRVLDELFFVTGRKIVAGVAPEVRIYQALEKYYGERRTPRYTILAEKLSRPVRTSRGASPNAPPPPPEFFPGPKRRATRTPAPQEIWGDSGEADAAEPQIIQSWKIPDQIVGGWAGISSPGMTAGASIPSEPETISWEEMPAMPSLWLPEAPPDSAAEAAAPAPTPTPTPTSAPDAEPPLAAPEVRAAAPQTAPAASPSTVEPEPAGPAPAEGATAEVAAPPPEPEPAPVEIPPATASPREEAPPVRAPAPAAEATPPPQAPAPPIDVAGPAAFLPPSAEPGPTAASVQAPADEAAPGPEPEEIVPPPAPPVPLPTSPTAAAAAPRPPVVSDFPEVAACLDRDSIATAALTALARRFVRSAVFVAKPDAVIAWGGEGQGISAEELRDISIPWSDPSVFLNVRLSRAFYLGPLPPLPRHQAIAIAMGGWPAECLVQPIQIREKPVAFLYAEFNEDQGATPMDLAYMRELALAASAAFVSAIRLKKKEI